jgi:hypothetical protein
MAGIIDNPIPRNGLFATPESAEAFAEYLMQFSGAERTVAFTAAQMAFNLAHKLVEAEIQAWPKVESFGYQGA